MGARLPDQKGCTAQVLVPQPSSPLPTPGLVRRQSQEELWKARAARESWGTILSSHNGQQE